MYKDQSNTKVACLTCKEKFANNSSLGINALRLNKIVFLPFLIFVILWIPNHEAFSVRHSRRKHWTEYCICLFLCKAPYILYHLVSFFSDKQNIQNVWLFCWELLWKITRLTPGAKGFNFVIFQILLMTGFQFQFYVIQIWGNFEY